MLLLQGAEIQSLVEELRSLILTTRSKKKINKSYQVNTPSENSDEGYKQVTSQKRNICNYIYEKLLVLIREYM